MAETMFTKEVTFPQKPPNISFEMEDYLRELENIIADLVKKSEILDLIMETGVLGN